MNLARLNHILIPSTRDGRERIRRSFVGRLFTPMGWLFGALTDEGRIFVVLLLFVGTAGLSVDTTQIYVLWSALVGLFVASLVVRRAFELRAVRLSVGAPRRVAAGDALTFELELESQREQPVYDVRIAAPFLPWDGRWLERPLASIELPRHGVGRVRMKAIFFARGEHQLDVFSAARLVPGGLATGPDVRSAAVRFLVVPRIAKVVRVALPIPSSEVGQVERRSSHARDGQELFGVRPYRRGDPVRELHARTWARRGEPHVREYRPMLSERIALVFDDDPAATEAAFEAGLSLVAGLASWLSAGSHDFVALAVGDAVHALPHRGGAGSLDAALDILAVAKRSRRLARGEVWLRIASTLGERSVVLIVTTGDASRGLLLEREAVERGCSARVFRVADEKWRFRRRNALAVDSTERTVSVQSIERRHPLSL